MFEGEISDANHGEGAGVLEEGGAMSFPQRMVATLQTRAGSSEAAFSCGAKRQS